MVVWLDAYVSLGLGELHLFLNVIKYSIGLSGICSVNGAQDFNHRMFSAVIREPTSDDISKVTNYLAINASILSVRFYISVDWYFEV